MTEDMLGLSPKVPKFVKEFATLGQQIASAAEAYANDVRARKFPEQKHTYALKEESE